MPSTSPKSQGILHEIEEFQKKKIKIPEKPLNVQAKESHLSSVAEESPSDTAVQSPEIDNGENSAVPSIIENQKPIYLVNENDVLTEDNLADRVLDERIEESTAVSQTGPWKKVITDRTEEYHEMSDDDEVEEVPIDRSPG